MSKRSKQKKRRKKKKQIRSVPMTNNNVDLEKLFCINAKKYKIPKLLLKAMGVVESALDPKAYRFEPGFWDRYLKDNPNWMDKEPEKVSASYGIMQLMYTTAWELGFRGEPEDLYNPVYNIELGAKLMRRHLDKMKEIQNIDPYIAHFPYGVACAWYNGGRKNNPQIDGRLRNPEYVDKVKIAMWKLLSAGDEECI